MPRFSGTPVGAAGPRFGGQPVGSIGAPAQQGVQQPSLMERIAGNPTIQSMLGTQQAQDLASPGKAFQAADDLARIGADTASFGFADPAIGYFTGQDERAKTQAARDRAGWAGTGMDLTTAVLTAPQLAGRVVSAGKGALPAVGRMLGYGAEGAGQAALSGYGHGERDPAQLLKDALIGGSIGTTASAIGGKVGSWLERRKAKAAELYKSAADVKAAASGKYGEVDKSGAHYPMAETDTMLAGLDKVLVDNTATSGLDDRAIAVVNRLTKDWKGKPISPAEVDKVRRWIDEKLIASDPRSADAQMGKKLKAEIDSFTTKSKPIDPVTGVSDPKVIADLEEARSLAARGYRAADVEKAASKAKKQADRTGSSITGGNIENTRRQQFGKIGERIDEGRTGGYSPDEVSRISQIAKGTLGRNIGRAASVFSPLRGGLPALAHLIAGPATGGLSTVAGLGSEAVAQLGRRATTREIEDLAALVRDPAGKGLTTDPAKVQQIRDLLARVMQSGVRAGGGP